MQIARSELGKDSTLPAEEGWETNIALITRLVHSWTGGLLYLFMIKV